MSRPAPTAADHRFCRELLPAVSRTFALSIEALPADGGPVGLRRPVRCAYLICRLLDTIEDAQLADEPRRALFEAFDQVLADDGLATTRLEQRMGRLLGDDVVAAERRLGAGAGAVMRVFADLPLADREAIRAPVQAMSRGMQDYAARGHRIDDVDDLERYCYYVAGTVGELLDGLFASRCPRPGQPADAGRQPAVSFGIGLQLVNIIKDVADDLTQGRCFIPRVLLDGQRLTPAELLVPAHREAAVAAVQPLVHGAEGHLAQAVVYARGWPAADPAGQAIRLFCAVPLALGRATLALAHDPDRLLRPSRPLKVSRSTVAAIVAASPAAACGETGFDALMDLAGGPT